MASLHNKVALVTGSSRGVGKGIALALAEQGTTVYVTGRTVQTGVAPLPGTIGETAAECDLRGGKGIAVAVDLTRDDEIAALFDRIGQEAGRLDILVNNAMAIPPEMTRPGAFWEKPLSNWEIFDVGLRAGFVAAWHAAQIMVPQRSGLIVGISGYVGVTYTYDTVFGTTKSRARPYGPRLGRGIEAVQRRFALALAGVHLHRTRAGEPEDGPWHGGAAQQCGGQFARVSRPGDRRAGARS